MLDKDWNKLPPLKEKIIFRNFVAIRAVEVGVLVNNTIGSGKSEISDAETEFRREGGRNKACC